MTDDDSKPVTKADLKRELALVKASMCEYRASLEALRGELYKIGDEIIATFGLTIEAVRKEKDPLDGVETSAGKIRGQRRPRFMQ